MSKIDALRRFFFPCIFPTTVTATQTTTSRKRLSTSLRDDLDDPPTSTNTTQQTQNQGQDQDQESTSPEDSTTMLVAPSRPSKSMVIGTIFGHRRGHVWFCVQHDRLSTKPTLLLELSIPTQQLVKEMRCGLVRIALECARPELCSCPLRCVPVWIMYCNGRKVGFAVRRKASGQNRLMLKTMQSMTVGAGAIPAGFGSSDSDSSEEIMYMRANYEHVIGGVDSESFHLINPDECPGQEFSVFLLRSR
ncbi:Protein MIZU-KUSSEI 1 [Melia azedarach]|uniref:Protein MIZU-KUSSEI 1 n=1 Tax=Melia azedarach TaxID=155640 RepID=A0ACC1X080_MELAZ|nr:Protein MIZU-KUSSEI 1 [Melia azedarach]